MQVKALKPFLRYRASGTFLPNSLPSRRLIHSRPSYTPKLVDDQRLKDCVDLLLTMQNPDGGFASYELVRGNKKLEWLNTAEVFGKLRALRRCIYPLIAGLLFRRYYD